VCSTVRVKSILGVGPKVEASDVLNAQALGMYGLIVGISSREKGRPTMRLSGMSLKKKNLLLKISF
jgi:hypothetical protein